MFGLVWAALAGLLGLLMVATVGLGFVTSGLSVAGGLLGAYFLNGWPRVRLPEFKLSLMDGALIGSMLFIHLALAWSVIEGRVEGPVYSPWHHLPTSHIWMYGLMTVYSIFLLWQQRVVVLVAGLWMWSTASLAALFYPLGFGFDPFLHRAAAEAIWIDGTISPLRPLYVGQYVWYVEAGHLLGVKFLWLDRFLLPLGSAIALGRWAYLMRADKRVALLPMIGLIPTFFWMFTVPVHLAFLVAMLTVLWWPRARSVKSLGQLLVVGLMIFLIHPMIGIPFLVVVGGWYFNWSGVVMAGGAVTLTYLAFIIFAWQQGGGFEISVEAGLAGLFYSPYEVANLAEVPWLTRFFYSWQYVMGYGWWLLLCWAISQKKREENRWLLWLSVGAALLAVLIATTLKFADIISFEQLEFARRYVVLAQILLVLYVIQIISPKIIYAMLMVPFVIAGFWLSYPQLNAYARFLSRNVTSEDYVLVRTIEGRAPGGVVLSDQLVSAAALDEFGFSALTGADGMSLRYALPTGGWLYDQYFQVMTGRLLMSELSAKLAEAGVNEFVFVVHDSWPVSEETFRELQRAERIFMGISSSAYLVSCHTFAICPLRPLPEPVPL